MTVLLQSEIDSNKVTYNLSKKSPTKTTIPAQKLFKNARKHASLIRSLVNQA